MRLPEEEEQLVTATKCLVVQYMINDGNEKLHNWQEPFQGTLKSLYNRDSGFTMLVTHGAIDFTDKYVN